MLYQLSYQPTTSVEEYQRPPDVSMQVGPGPRAKPPRTRVNPARISRVTAKEGPEPREERP